MPPKRRVRSHSQDLGKPKSIHEGRSQSLSKPDGQHGGRSHSVGYKAEEDTVCVFGGMEVRWRFGKQVVDVVKNGKMNKKNLQDFLGSVPALDTKRCIPAIVQFLHYVVGVGVPEGWSILSNKNNTWINRSNLIRMDRDWMLSTFMRFRAKVTKGEDFEVRFNVTAFSQRCVAWKHRQHYVILDENVKMSLLMLHYALVMCSCCRVWATQFIGGEGECKNAIVVAIFDYMDAILNDFKSLTNKPVPSYLLNIAQGQVFHNLSREQVEKHVGEVLWPDKEIYKFRYEEKPFKNEPNVSLTGDESVLLELGHVDCGRRGPILPSDLKLCGCILSLLPGGDDKMVEVMSTLLKKMAAAQ